MMDLDAILQLIRAANDSTFDRVEVCDAEFSLKLERSSGGRMLPQKNAAPVHAAESEPREQLREPDQVSAGALDITSPLVGVFHQLPEGRAVKVGDHLSKGDILCMVEAMKLMNELTMPEDGEIVSINAHNDQMVEYGDLLYRYIADSQA